MWVRRAMYGWLIPAAFVLPAWLLIGWIAFGASAWALLWVFLSIPIVFVLQLVFTFLVRARGTVRAHRAVSWTDVAGFGAWHVLIIALGLFDPSWWWPVFFITVAVGIAMFWMLLSQLWSEARPGATLRTSAGAAYIPPPTDAAPGARAGEPEIFVINEKRTDERS
ncbi:MFS transporter permease [Microbacterium fluvii]|uniref:MFS transporter permease n=1 Tax=Microbacterium fluvii TaxID=415215 RepID=A0ABW2HCE9_9MICO|nr:MFS transporter permease [Microbacterium fluvii]MCU4672567.1 MFS transporter permease [Microbacterium fluvii]